MFSPGQAAENEPARLVQVASLVPVKDQATLLRALGLDHRRLTYPHDGRDDSLTDADVTKARVVHELLA